MAKILDLNLPTDEMVERVASALANDWQAQNASLRGDRFKPAKVRSDRDRQVIAFLQTVYPSFVRVAENGDIEIDILKCGFYLMTDKWQNEQLDPARFLVKRMSKITRLSKSEVTTLAIEIHEDWKNRNWDWLKDDQSEYAMEMKGPWHQMSQNLKDMDTNQVYVASRILGFEIVEDEA